jgi:hypothetical protein
MERQLALKGICSVDEWNELKQKIHYDFLKDNNFAELKEAELLATRLQIMQQIDPYVGVYFSKDWIRKKVLRMDEEEIEEIGEQIEEEQAEEPAMPMSTGVPGAAAPASEAMDLNQAFNSQLTK